MSTLNGFKCNLHVFVHFASRAELGLTIWEQAVLDFKENDEISNVKALEKDSCSECQH
jgi:hypothetical protein